MTQSTSTQKIRQPSGADTAHDETIPALLDAIRRELSSNPAKTKKQVYKRMSDFVTLANRLAQALETTLDRLTVAQVVEKETAFLCYLAQSNLSPVTKEHSSNTRNALLRYARKFGFSPDSFTLLNAWDPIMNIAPLDKGSLSIVRDAIGRGCRPSDYSQEDLTAWADAKLAAGRTYSHVRDAQRLFMTRIRRAGLEGMFPLLDTAPRFPSYRLQIDLMPKPLRDEIFEVMASRRAQAGLGRIRLAPTTERIIIKHFEALVGYAVGFRGMVDLTSIHPLINQPFITAYALFLTNERGCKRTTAVGHLSMMFSTLSCSPAFRERDLSWIDDVYTKLLKDPESALKERRRQRDVPFKTLALIPGKMRRERLSLVGPSPWTLAWKIHDELLLSCLIFAQWPPRFLRLAELGKHILKGPIPQDGPPFAIPEWVKEQLNQNPKAEFWQYCYEDLQEELHRGVVLRQIVPLLELYVEKHRPLLLDPDNPKLLFCNRSGKPLTATNLGTLTSCTVWRYLEKRVTPTSIRSSFAYYWRAKYPDKDAVLANIQWVDYPTIKLRYDEDYRKQRAARVYRRKHRYS